MSEAIPSKPLRLSGSQPFTQQHGVYIMIGERTNVAGSPKFAKLIKAGKYEAAVSVARRRWCSVTQRGVGRSRARPISLTRSELLTG